MAGRRLGESAIIFVHYSLDLKPSNQFQIRTSPLAQDLTLAVHEEAVKSSAHVLSYINPPGTEDFFLKYVSNGQLDFISKIRRLFTEPLDAILVTGEEYNTQSISVINPPSISRTWEVSAPLTKLFLDCIANLELRWCYTEFPTYTGTLEADTSLFDYQEFVYPAGLLDVPNFTSQWEWLSENC